MFCFWCNVSYRNLYLKFAFNISRDISEEHFSRCHISLADFTNSIWGQVFLYILLYFNLISTLFQVPAVPSLCIFPFFLSSFFSVFLFLFFTLQFLHLVSLFLFFSFDICLFPNLDVTHFLFLCCIVSFCIFLFFLFLLFYNFLFSLFYLFFLCFIYNLCPELLFTRLFASMWHKAK